MNFHKPLLEIVNLTLFLPPRKNLLIAENSFSTPGNNFFLLAAHHFSRHLHLCKLTGSKQDEEVRRPVEKRVILRGVSVKLNHSLT